jgi:RNA polymerase sigma-70 factor (ECF subfamily)
MPTHEALLAGMCDEAEAAWPEFRVERPLFMQRLREVVAESAVVPSASSGVHHVDLYLAFACSLGERAAITAFTRRYLSRMDQYLRRFANSSALFDEVRTTLEDKLLFSVANEGARRIRQYTGRGPLEAWVAMAAQRTMLSMLRARGAAPGMDSTTGLYELWAEAYELGREQSQRYAESIKEILRHVIRSLPVRQRTILRLSIVEDVSLSQIARMLKVNQSTISRAFHASLEKVNEEVRTRLKQLHGMRDSEVDSIVRELQSRIDLSLSGVFADAPGLVASLNGSAALPID